MIRFFIFILVACAPAAEAATSGKGKALGSVADSPRGSTGGGGSGRRYNDPRKAPPLDESRKVSEQDCSKPVDLQSGNLRCK
jgi:hypothetical protein